jgi:hypothetical protein
MLRILTSSFVAFTFAVIVGPALIGQQAKEIASAPIPAQILAARKVFIANAGADIAAQATFKRAGQPDQAYNNFYAAMQSWGKFDLVSNPADADLVFEIRFAAPLYYNGNLASYAPQFGLNIVDVKTHFVLWSLAEPVEGAFRKTTWLKNFDQGLGLLMDDLKKLTAAPTALGPLTK